MALPCAPGRCQQPCVVREFTMCVNSPSICICYHGATSNSRCARDIIVPWSDQDEFAIGTVCPGIVLPSCLSMCRRPAYGGLLVFRSEHRSTSIINAVCTTSHYLVGIFVQVYTSLAHIITVFFSPEA
ncbi:unnamed protein product [Laminaria digitata]